MKEKNYTHETDRLFGQKLSEEEVTPPDSAWKKIESRMDDTQKKPSAWVWWLSGILLVAGISAIFYSGEIKKYFSGDKVSSLAGWNYNDPGTGVTSKQDLPSGQTKPGDITTTNNNDARNVNANNDAVNSSNGNNVSGNNSVHNNDKPSLPANDASLVSNDKKNHKYAQPTSNKRKFDPSDEDSDALTPGKNHRHTNTADSNSPGNSFASSANAHSISSGDNSKSNSDQENQVRIRMTLGAQERREDSLKKITQMEQQQKMYARQQHIADSISNSVLHRDSLLRAAANKDSIPK
ncbi:MAG: hypothetical protein HY064_01330 [Bacteroidetes bacterium]|nr:hypothetical protein [Bacteroidota bacterium]